MIKLNNVALPKPVEATLVAAHFLEMGFIEEVPDPVEQIVEMMLDGKRIEVCTDENTGVLRGVIIWSLEQSAKSMFVKISYLYLSESTTLNNVEDLFSLFFVKAKHIVKDVKGGFLEGYILCTKHMTKRSKDVIMTQDFGFEDMFLQNKFPELNPPYWLVRLEPKEASTPRQN